MVSLPSLHTNYNSGYIKSQEKYSYFIGFKIYKNNYEKINAVKLNMYMDRLRELRNNRNITQATLSSLLEIHEYVYGQYEREYVIIPLKHLNTLSNYFNVSLDYIFEFTNTINYEYTNTEINSLLSGQRLKEFRKDNKLSQVKLAALLNTVQPVIANYENGKHLIATPFLYQICKKYSISADYLLGKIDSPKYINK